MATPIISISSDSSEENVGSHTARVIMFGTIPNILPAIPEILAEVPTVPTDPLATSGVRGTSDTSPARVLDLVIYSPSFDSDLPDDPLPPAPELPLVSPFLYLDNSEADRESKLSEQRPKRHVSLAEYDAEISRWRDRVASRPSSPSGSLQDTSTPLSDLPIALIVAPPRTRRWSAVLVLPGEIGMEACTSSIIRLSLFI
ncbi:hypothetical protein Tco_0540720, partial [Tanacetum coccineum]